MFWRGGQVLSAILILLVVGLALAGLLVAGTVFLQGYFYTEVQPGVFWRGPVMAAIFVAFLFFWCLLNYLDPQARPASMPFDTLFRASASTDMVSKPFSELWVLRKGSKNPVKFELFKDVQANRTIDLYKEAGSGKRWDSNIEAVIIKHNGQDIRFDRKTPTSRGEYTYYESPAGWIMRDYGQGVNGIPTAFNTGLFLLDLLLNFLHLVLWVLGLWLLLRYQFWHALGIGLALWVAMTLLVVPILFDQAATRS